MYLTQTCFLQNVAKSNKKNYYKYVTEQIKFKKKKRSMNWMSTKKHSQQDRSLHCDHGVQGVQWVQADHLNRLFQQGQRVQVVPVETVWDVKVWRWSI